MSDQIKIPNLKIIGLTLAGITASITFAAQALASNSISFVNQSKSGLIADVYCSNGSKHKHIEAGGGEICYKDKNQVLRLKAIVHTPEGDRSTTFEEGKQKPNCYWDDKNGFSCQ